MDFSFRQFQRLFSFSFLLTEKYVRTYLGATCRSSILPKIYEWEPYLGYNSDAIIIHWHGYKVPVTSCNSTVSKDSLGFLNSPLMLNQSMLPLPESLHFLYVTKDSMSGYQEYFKVFKTYFKELCPDSDLP